MSQKQGLIVGGIIALFWAVVFIVVLAQSGKSSSESGSEAKEAKKEVAKVEPRKPKKEPKAIMRKEVEADPITEPRQAQPTSEPEPVVAKKLPPLDDIYVLDPINEIGIKINPKIKLPDPTEKTPPKKQPEPKSKSEPEKEIPIPGKLFKEIVPGYQTRQIQGFTVLLSTKAIEEAKKQGGKPFQAIIDEFDGLVRVLPAHSLNNFRRTGIWIEWDNVDPRRPNVLAKYYAAWVWELPPTEHPLKAAAVDVVSLKNVTRVKAMSKSKPQLVFLHEMSHMIHHKVVGEDYPDVELAYRQAMERGLYQKVMHDSGKEARAYAATNKFEYFAELSCAYLDRGSFYPFTREELREYDFVGYKLMELVWGRPKPPAKVSQPRTDLPKIPD
jgi:hypothetical protein